MNIKDTKEFIYFHRAYKRFPAYSAYKYILKFLFITLPFVAGIVIFSSDITYIFCLLASKLKALPFNAHSYIISEPYSIFNNLYSLGFPGKYPSKVFSLVTLFVSFCGIIGIHKIKKIPKSISIYISFIFFVTIISALFFIFFADKFPYNIENFSDLYMKTEIGIWLMIPFLMGLSIISLPAGIMEQFSIVGITLLYSIIFGFLRYVIFLYILDKCNYIFMATMFIAFDPPIDAIYIIGIYSFYASKVALRIKDNVKIWK